MLCIHPTVSPVDMYVSFHWIFCVVFCATALPADPEPLSLDNPAPKPSLNLPSNIAIGAYKARRAIHQLRYGTASVHQILIDFNPSTYDLRGTDPQHQPDIEILLLNKDEQQRRRLLRIDTLDTWGKWDATWYGKVQDGEEVPTFKLRDITLSPQNAADLAISKMTTRVRAWECVTIEMRRPSEAYAQDELVYMFHWSDDLKSAITVVVGDGTVIDGAQ